MLMQGVVVYKRIGLAGLYSTVVHYNIRDWVVSSQRRNPHNTFSTIVLSLLQKKCTVAHINKETKKRRLAHSGRAVNFLPD